MNQESLLAQFDALLPLAAAWAAEQELEIFREGVSLSLEEIADARAIGVNEPDRVRLLRVDTIPRPMQPQLRAACDAIDFLNPQRRPNLIRFEVVRLLRQCSCEISGLFWCFSLSLLVFV